MFQGETISVTISGFPIPISTIRSIRVVYLLDRVPCIELTEEDCSFNTSDDTVSFVLSQEQSLKLKAGLVSRHVVVVTDTGSRFEAKIDDEQVEMTAVRKVLE